MCALPPQTQVYSNARVSEESGDLVGWDMAVIEQRDSTASLTLYTYEGQLNDEAIRLTGRIAGKKLTAKGRWSQGLIEMPQGKDIVNAHSVTVDGTIDSSSFQGTIEIDGYNANGKIVLKRVKHIWGCKP